MSATRYCDVGIRKLESPKTQFHPPVGRNQSLPPGSQHKPLDPHPPGGRHQKQEELQFCSLRHGGHKHRKLDKTRWQRNMSQTKEQDKTPEGQLREVEIGNLTKKEFRVMIVEVIQDLGKRMEAQIEKIHEMFNKELEVLKNRDEQYNY